MKHWDRLNDLDTQLYKLESFNEMLELMVEGLQASGDVHSRFTNAFSTCIHELEKELINTRANFDRLWRDVQTDSLVVTFVPDEKQLDVTTGVKLAKQRRKKPAAKKAKKKAASKP